MAASSSKRRRRTASSGSSVDVDEHAAVTVVLADARFLVLPETLRRKDGLLNALVAERWSSTRKREVFVEGEGAEFRKVLQYLREPDDFAPPPPGPEKRALHQMARRLCMDELQVLTRPFAVESVEKFSVVRLGEAWQLGWRRGDTHLRASLTLPSASFDLELRSDKAVAPLPVGRGFMLGFAEHGRCCSIGRMKLPRLWTPDKEHASVGRARDLRCVDQRPEALRAIELRPKELPANATQVTVWPERIVEVVLEDEDAKTMAHVYVFARPSSTHCRLFDTGFLADMPDGSCVHGLTTWQHDFGRRRPGCSYYVACFSRGGNFDVVLIGGGVTRIVLSRRSALSLLSVSYVYPDGTTGMALQKLELDEGLCACAEGRLFFAGSFESGFLYASERAPSHKSQWLSWDKPEALWREPSEESRSSDDECK